jgi:plastocyanin
MKTTLLLFAMALVSSVAFSAKVTITNSGFEFSPDDITINAGDTVIFQLASAHNAVEVSESTWALNGNTPLAGGFSLPFGGGQLTGLTTGVHFYVCQPHASSGMKGKITVNSSSGIFTPEAAYRLFTIYPNPSKGKFFLKFDNASEYTGNEKDLGLSVEIYNLLGEKIFSIPGFIPQTSNEIDLTSSPAGYYFVKVSDGKKVSTQKVLVQ